MRKLLLLVALVAAVTAWSVPSASATIHPLVCSERSAAPTGTPAQTQNPPGITNEGHEGNTDPDPDHATQAQPVLVAAPQAFKPVGC
jgi:hypothetical protein